MATRSSSRPSVRAERFWKRLTQWYGARWTDQYGAEAPPDWCELVDRAEDSAVRQVLDLIRQRHPTHPPTFPECEALFADARAPKAKRGPTPQDLLADYVIRTYGALLTPQQLRGPWSYIGRRFDAPDATGKTREGHGIEITALEIPPDREAGAPGYRVTVEDMQSGNAA